MKNACDIHECPSKWEREQETARRVKADINVNNAIYLSKTNKNIYKLCETKEVFSNYLAEILMSNIRVFSGMLQFNYIWSTRIWKYYPFF